MIDYQQFEATCLREPEARPAHDNPAPHTLALALHRAGSTAGVARILRAPNTQPAV